MIGRTVGRFRVVGELGRGGMATVWEAEDTLLGRRVALKILSDELAGSPEARRRFLREAKTNSLLDHPGVPTVFDYGESENVAYIALTLIDGETLAARAARCPMPVAEAVRIVQAAAHALGYAHGRRVIHRDVTGRNVMVARDGRVYVLDFGLALAAGDSRITSSRTVLGTFSYMAPEVVENKDADSRSDLYGLGVVLYEALTGRVPFKADRRETAVWVALNTEPTPPRALRPDVPEAVEAIVLKAIARRREDRFQSAEEFATALGAVALPPGDGAGASSLPLPSSWTPPVPASEERTMPMSRGGRGTTYLAVLPFSDASTGQSGAGDRELVANGLAQSLSAALARLPSVHVIPSANPPDPAGAADLQALARRVGANAVLRGSVRHAGARLRVTWTLHDPWRGDQIAGETVEGIDASLFEIEDRLAAGVRRALGYEDVRVSRPPRTVPRDPAALERYLQALGYLQRRDSEAALDGAVALLERLIESEGESAQVLATLGRACLEKFRVSWNREWEARAAAACQRALELDRDAPEVLETLGEVHFSAGRYEDAIRDFRRAIEQRPEMVEASLGLARALEATGCFQEAEESCRRAIGLRPDDWRSHSQLGMLYLNRGRYAEALSAFRRVIELVPDNPRGHSTLGSALYRLDRLDEAQAAYRRSIEIQPTPRALANLAAVLFLLQRYEESADAYEKAAALSPFDPLMWGNLGSACRWIPGRANRAAEALERAIALMNERLERNPRDAQGWAWLSAWLANRRRDTEAITAIEKALGLAPDDVHCMATAGSVYNLLGDRALALKWYREAVRCGYGVEKLRRDPELAALSGDPEFIRVLEEGSVRSGAETAGKPDPGGAA
jgi:serine/threonine protein kinase/tetratricopeptide (TPR) repeat protein